MNTDNLTYPRDIFVLGVFDHGNASGGASPSHHLLLLSGGGERPEGTAPRSAAGHRRSCKHAGPRRLIRPTAASVRGIRAAGGRRADKVFLPAAVKKTKTKKNQKKTQRSSKVSCFHPDSPR